MRKVVNGERVNECKYPLLKRLGDLNEFSMKT